MLLSTRTFELTREQARSNSPKCNRDLKEIAEIVAKVGCPGLEGRLPKFTPLTDWLPNVFERWRERYWLERR
jgi:hypothetical protein